MAPGVSPKKPTRIKFPAAIGHIEINSHSAKVSLLIPDSHMAQVSELMQSKMPNTYLEIIATVKKKKVEKKVTEKKLKRGVRRARFGKYKD